MSSLFSIPLRRNVPESSDRPADSLRRTRLDGPARLTPKHVRIIAAVAGVSGVVSTSTLAGLVVGVPLVGLVLGLILVALIVLAGLMI